ncbi:MAG: VOC family protein [Chloroflexota bacterium]|jgi:catechol 2,3-dioxygenase-like lactoylglutathione lyase family enzyme
MTTSTAAQASSSVEPLDVVYLYSKLPAQDVERAQRFYEEKLGLRPYKNVHGHLYYEVGGVRFVIFPSKGQASGTADQLGFLVNDVEREVAKLGARGVAFEEFDGLTKDGIMDQGFMKAAWFKDSEGNLLSIAERVPIAPG